MLIAHCDLQPYKARVFQEKTIWVHSGFVPSMDRIKKYAEDCNVKVTVNVFQAEIP